MTYDTDAQLETRAPISFIELIWDDTDTYRFRSKAVEIPPGYGDLSSPLIESISVTPFTLKPGQGLGVQQSITVTFRNDPEDVGTFWGKFRANNPFYLGQKLIRETGYRKAAYVQGDMIREEYRITSMSGPTAAGMVTIQATGALRLANRKKALVPIPTTAALTSIITPQHSLELVNLLDGAAETSVNVTTNIPTASTFASGNIEIVLDDGTTFTQAYTSFSGKTFTIPATDYTTTNADPGTSVTSGAVPFTFSVTATEGDNNFGTTGEVNIGGEIIDYTRTLTSDVLTAVARGVAGTVIDAHEIDDDVQEVYKKTDILITDLYEDWLIGNGPSGEKYMQGLTLANINTAQWDTEENFLLTFTFADFRVPEPTAVEDLLNQGQEQCMNFIWWDGTTSLVNLEAIKPVFGVVPEITDESNILIKSFSTVERPDDRVTRLQIYYNQKDESKRLDELDNYANFPTNVNLTSEANWGEKSVRQIQSRFLETRGQFVQVSGRIIDRFADVPKTYVFTVDAKDRSLFSIAAVFDLTTRFIEGTDGLPDTTRCQVIGLTEVTPGLVWQVTAEKFGFTSRFGLITPNTNPEDEPNPFPDYTPASDALKLQYGFISANSAPFFPDASPPYVII